MTKEGDALLIGLSKLNCRKCSKDKQLIEQ